MGWSKGTAAAETARASQGLQRHGVDDTVARRRWGKMEDGAEVDGAESDIDMSQVKMSPQRHQLRTPDKLLRG